MSSQGPASSLKTTKMKFFVTTKTRAIARPNKLMAHNNIKLSLIQSASSERNALKTKRLKTAFSEKLLDIQVLITVQKMIIKKSV